MASSACTDSRVSRTQLFIGNAFVDGVAQNTIEVINPATEEVLARVSLADEKDVNLAVDAAKAALPAWKKLAPKSRAQLIWTLSNLIERDREKLALLETLNTGKPLQEALSCDLQETIDCFRYFAGWADKGFGEVAQMEEGFHAYVVHEPRGVVGLIVPWNYPLLMATWKLAPALACGNTIVLKPSEITPLTSLALGDLIIEAGFPPGVINIVPGDGKTAGSAIVRHPAINKVSFTGSTAVGKDVMVGACEKNLKRVTLELGGKSANVVLADADLDKAVEGSYGAIFANQGHNCVAGSRLFVQSSVYEAFVQKLVAHIKSYTKLGDPLSKETNYGSLFSKAAFDKVMQYIEKGQQEGAKLLQGGKRVGSQGYFVEPTIFTEVKDEMSIAREEIFGPVVSVLRFETLDEVIERANALEYGLGAAVWTKDYSKAHKFAAEVQAGMVWINSYNINPANLPFGGYKSSGFGRDLGRAALEEYQEVKSVIWKLNDQ